MPLTVGCSRGQSTSAAAAAPAAPKLGIRPNGHTEIQPDLSKIDNEDLKKVFQYIDQHIDEHVQNLQKWMRADEAVWPRWRASFRRALAPQCRTAITSRVTEASC